MLSPEEMAIITSHAIRRRYRNGEIIHERGDRQPAIGIVISGKIKLIYPCRDGQETFSGLIHTGQNYGDAALFHGESRAHRAIAIGETVVDHLDRNAFNQLLEHPAIVRALYLIASFRLSVALDLLDDMRLLSPEVRLAKLIARMHVAGGGSERLEFLQEDFAGMLGVSTVTLAKSLRQLERRGLVEAGYRHIRVTDPSRLAAWVQEEAAG
jgi:CRP-like cAMP-binding protein